MEPAKSHEEMLQRLQLQENETMDDILSVRDAKKRYGISRCALSQAAVLRRLKSIWFGGESRKVRYFHRKDIIKYLLLPQSKSKSKIVVPWRIQDKPRKQKPTPVDVGQVSQEAQ
jgi:hypothetical protein